MAVAVVAADTEVGSAVVAALVVAAAVISLSPVLRNNISLLIIRIRLMFGL